MTNRDKFKNESLEVVMAAYAKAHTDLSFEKWLDARYEIHTTHRVGDVVLIEGEGGQTSVIIEMDVYTDKVKIQRLDFWMAKSKSGGTEIKKLSTLKIFRKPLCNVNDLVRSDTARYFLTSATPQTKTVQIDAEVQIQKRSEQKHMSGSVEDKVIKYMRKVMMIDNNLLDRLVYRYTPQERCELALYHISPVSDDSCCARKIYQVAKIYRWLLKSYEYGKRDLDRARISMLSVRDTDTICSVPVGALKLAIKQLAYSWLISRSDAIKRDAMKNAEKQCYATGTTHEYRVWYFDKTEVYNLVEHGYLGKGLTQNWLPVPK